MFVEVVSARVGFGGLEGLGIWIGSRMYQA